MFKILFKIKSFLEKFVVLFFGVLIIDKPIALCMILCT